MEGRDEKLEVGTCGHPKCFLFKCPTRNDTAKCVQCAVCMVGGVDTTCSAIMGDRPDYAELPEMPNGVRWVLSRAADEAYKFRMIRGALKDVLEI